jgi:hypothetical protein
MFSREAKSCEKVDKIRGESVGFAYLCKIAKKIIYSICEKDN